MTPELGKAYRASRGFSVALTTQGKVILVEHQALPEGEPVHLMPGWDAHAPPGYDTMVQALFRLRDLPLQGYDVGPLDYQVIIPLIGHFRAYLLTSEERDRPAYWAAAGDCALDMKEIEEQLAEEDGIRSWALRLGAMHGRLLSSNERVELCAHWDPEVREFALTAPGADEAPAKKKRKPRSR